ncbi:MerR family transcriptional regulator [Nocardia sp. NPDC059177]|uniref:helix-turn-helix domain-containing protein n=1 Tax=Nocardia sp. NPDC059177 TaxID=3346759 RepID=UPI0036AE7E3C
MLDGGSGSAMVSIGELARATGVPVRTIRYYCDEGIVQAQRSAGGHRVFDAESATRQLVLVRRLRALGLGLEAIVEVLRGQRSIAEAVAAESVRLDLELRTLAWRRASLRAVEAATPAEREARLGLLAAAQDGHAVRDCVVQFWRRMLSPLTPRDLDTFVCGNIPELPADPSVSDVVAYAELAALVGDATLYGAVGRQLWRTRPEAIRDRRALFLGVGEVLVDVLPLVATGTRPDAGVQLDRFVDVHAGARAERDSPRFRAELLVGATDTDQRIHRYWTLTAQLFGGTATVGHAHGWLFDALCGPAADRHELERVLYSGGVVPAIPQGVQRCTNGPTKT